MSSFIVILKIESSDVYGVAYFITGHEQTQPESSTFISFVYFLLLKDLTAQNLFLSY